MSPCAGVHVSTGLCCRISLRGSTTAWPSATAAPAVDSAATAAAAATGAKRATSTVTATLTAILSNGFRHRTIMKISNSVHNTIMSLWVSSDTKQHDFFIVTSEETLYNKI